MKYWFTIVALLSTLHSNRFAAAQQTISNRPLPGQPAVLTIQQALATVGLTNVVYKDDLNVGGAIGTLYEKASSDPNRLEILFVKTSIGIIHLKTTWNYYTPANQPSQLYIAQIANPAAGASLVDENSANVNVDTTRAVQIRNDRGAVKIFATNGHTYILDMFYAYDGSNYYLLFTAPNNLASGGGMTRTKPGPPEQPPYN